MHPGTAAGRPQGPTRCTSRLQAAAKRASAPLSQCREAIADPLDRFSIKVIADVAASRTTASASMRQRGHAWSGLLAALPLLVHLNSARTLEPVHLDSSFLPRSSSLSPPAYSSSKADAPDFDRRRARSRLNAGAAGCPSDVPSSGGSLRDGQRAAAARCTPAAGGAARGSACRSRCPGALRLPVTADAGGFVEPGRTRRCAAPRRGGSARHERSSRPRRCSVLAGSRADPNSPAPRGCPPVRASASKRLSGVGATRSDQR